LADVTVALVLLSLVFGLGELVATENGNQEVFVVQFDSTFQNSSNNVLVVFNVLHLFALILFEPLISNLLRGDLLADGVNWLDPLDAGD